MIHSKLIKQFLVADIITTSIKNLGLEYPKVGEARLARLAQARARLEGEDKPDTGST